MKYTILILALVAGIQVSAQTSQSLSPFDPRHWDVVLEHPKMAEVTVMENVPYIKDEKGTMTIDIYLPKGMTAQQKRPAVIFLNGIGENPGQIKVKQWGIYKSWPRLMAANGFIGISMESDGSRIQESFQALFKYLNESGSKHHIDPNQIGVYAASANVTQSVIYLMGNDAYKGIKAAVLYYGGTPNGPFRKDLPVLFVISEGDVPRNRYTTLWTEVLKNNAPWTIKMGTGLPHGFDGLDDTNESRRMVKETISFWKDQLEPIPSPSWSHSIPREILSAQYMHDDNKAADLTRKWLDTHPGDAEAYRGYGVSLKNAGRFAEAEEVYTKLLEKQPEDPYLLADFALVKFSLGKSEEAEKLMTRAIGTGGLNKYHYLTLGRSLYYLRNYQASAKYYELALQVEPNSVDYYNQACSYALANEKDKAFRSLDNAVGAGFNSKQQVEGDEDLVSLRSDPRYKILLEKLR